MTGSEFPSRPAPTTGHETIDMEHGVQLGLVEASLTALTGSGDEAPELVEQLFTYTQAHFLYEQLLMRRSARPNYEGHVQEHEKLLQQVTTVRDRTRNTDYEGAALELKAHEHDLVEHIRTWDMSVE